MSPVIVHYPRFHHLPSILVVYFLINLLPNGLSHFWLNRQQTIDLSLTNFTFIFNDLEIITRHSSLIVKTLSKRQQGDR